MAPQADWDTDEGLEKIAKFCRAGFAVRSGIERLRNAHDTDRRVEYFRGEKLTTFLLGDLEDDGDAKSKKKKAKRVFTAKDTAEARDVVTSMMAAGYIHRASRVAKGQFEFEPKQIFEPRDYYIWDYDGPKGFSNFMTGLLIVGMLVCTCFPIWPHFLKVYLWYLSVTFLIFMSIFCTLRMILFMNMWVLGYEVWILPNLFDEELTFADSFKPRYSFEDGAKGQRYYRFSLMLLTFAFFAWAYNQPTDFDLFIDAQKEFVDDLYTGKLLTDFSQQSKEDIDLVKRPSWASLAEAQAEEEAAEREAEDLQELHRKNLEGEADPDYDPEAEAEEADAMMEAMMAEDDEDE